MKKVIVITLLLLCSFSFSQNYKFGKVSKEELAEKTYNNDTTANAAVLYRYQKTNYEYESGSFFKVTEVFERIKIYNQEGYKWATKKLKLYNKSKIKSEKLKGLKGNTYNLVKGKVVKDKLKKEGIFEEKNNEYWETTKFTMPNIKEGSVIEYSYRIESPFISVDDIILQYDIPIKKAEVSILIPEYFIFNKIVNPKATYRPELTNSTVQRRILSSNSQVSYSNNQATIGTNKKQSEWKFIENKTLVEDSNIPALKKEVMVPNINNYRAKLIMEYSAYKNADGFVKSFSTTWDDVSKTIYKSSSFGAELKKTNYYSEDIDRIVDETSTPIEKASTIYNYVKSKVKWNNFVGYSSGNGLKKAYKTNTGSTADINLMLTSMLRYVGLKANPVLLSTRDNGIPLHPTTEGFNYVITAIEFPEGIVYLDATNTYGTANILPEYAINWRGRIIREGGTSDWVTLTPQTKSKEIALMNVEINDDLSISGKIRKQLTEYLALGYRDKYYTTNNDAIIKDFEDGKGDIEITNLSIKNKEALNKPISYTYDYKLNNEVEEIGDKLYISPLLFLAPEENPFKQDSRTYPIDFIYPLYSKYSITIKIPEGYAVESIPENAKVQLNGVDGEFSYIVKSLGNKLQVMVTTNLNKTLILPAEYEQFKQFFQLSFEKQTDKIVLKKV